MTAKPSLISRLSDAFKGYDLDNDGYISRDELFRMFKAYFYLSMELVRDVLSAMEDDMMDNFEFSASQPVSAAFTVAIPSGSSDEDDRPAAEGRGSLRLPPPRQAMLRLRHKDSASRHRRPHPLLVPGVSGGDTTLMLSYVPAHQ